MGAKVWCEEGDGKSVAGEGYGKEGVWARVGARVAREGSRQKGVSGRVSAKVPLGKGLGKIASRQKCVPARVRPKLLPAKGQVEEGVGNKSA